MSSPVIPEYYYPTKEIAATAIAVAKGWTKQEHWSVEHCCECLFWTEGNQPLVEVMEYSPLTDSNIIRTMSEYDLNIKPTYRMRNGHATRRWQVMSSHGPYQKRFESAYMWDAVAQWLVGYHEFNRILKKKVDLV